MRRLAILLSTAFALALLGAPAPAWAAVPANDEPAGAIPLGALPTTVTQDTGEATYAAYGGCTSADAGANVWYTLTSGTGARVLVDASASDYNTGLNIFAGAPGGDTFLACSEQSLRFDAAAGVTYYVEVAACCGSSLGGNLVLAVSEASPPPVVTLTVDATGRFDHAGNATVGGTASCSAAVTFASVEVFLSEPVGRVSTVTGQNGVNLSCVPGGPPVPWSMVVPPGEGRFRGGHAHASAQWVGCNPVECAYDYVDADVRLRG